MIRPLAAPRFTRRARTALREFARLHAGAGEPVLRVEATRGLGDETELFLQFVDAGSPRKPGEVDRVDRPVSLRFTPATGDRLVEHLIDFLDEEGVRGFRVRPAGPPGPRAPGPSSVPLPGDLETAVRSAIEDHVNPLVACHGGAVELLRLRQDPRGPVAEVEMRGGCQGCGAARDTLRDVVARILRKGVPELVGVEDVTDHDAGVSPFFPAG